MKFSVVLLALSILFSNSVFATQRVVLLLNQFPDPVSVTIREGGSYIGGTILGTLEKPHTNGFVDEAILTVDTEKSELLVQATFGYQSAPVSISMKEVEGIAAKDPLKVIPICLYRSASGMFYNTITPVVGTRDCKNSGRPEAAPATEDMKRPFARLPGGLNLSFRNDFGDALNLVTRRQGLASAKTTIGDQRVRDLGNSDDIENLSFEGTGSFQGKVLAISKEELSNCYHALSKRGEPVIGIEIRLENFTAFKASIAWTCSTSEPVVYKEVDLFNLVVKNKNATPIHVRIIDAKIPKDTTSSGVFGAIGAISYNMLKGGTRSKSLEARTDSRLINPSGETTLRLPKVAVDDFRYVYWDTKPIDEDGQGGYTLKGYFDLASNVPQNKRILEISSDERIMELARGVILDARAQEEFEAQVQSGSPSEMPLMPDEQNALRNREKKTAETIIRIAGEHRVLPRVGLCMSGGGLRAMYSGLGFSIGMQEEGILDAVSYAAGLSGSTWFLMKWLKDSDKGLNGVRQDLVSSMVKGLEPEEIEDPSTMEKGKRAAEQLLLGSWYSPAEGFRAQLAATTICPEGKCPAVPRYRTVDLWAHALSRSVFKGEDKYNFTLSSLAPTAIEGRTPLPLFTAIRTESDDEYAAALKDWQASGGMRDEQPLRDYQWFEATPFSASFLAAQKGAEPVKRRIPMRALGRKFEKSQAQKEASLNFKPLSASAEFRGRNLFRREPSAGQLLAAFGSAFSPTLGEVAKLSSVANVSFAAAGVAGPILLSKLVGGSAAEWQNGYQKWLTQTNLAKGLLLYDFVKGGDNQMELRDGGLFYNLPLAPLFDPQRKLDIIVVNDASGDLHEKLGGELDKFRRFAKDNAYSAKLLPHDLIDEQGFKAKMSKIQKGANVAVFNDPREAGFDVKQITIVYVPTYHKGSLNQKPTQKFGTFKLKYEESESNELINYNIDLVRSISKDLKDLIRARAEIMSR